MTFILIGIGILFWGLSRLLQTEIAISLFYRFFEK